MFIEAPELSSHSSVRHAFFTREGGVSAGIYRSLNGGLGSGDDPAAVAENRRRMAAQLALPPGALLSLYQIHSATVVLVDEPWNPEARPRADGMATKVPGLALAIATADCGPVLFADPDNAVVGACHAGWKGALTGVLEATIAGMEELGAERSAIVAALGPTISQDAYEVGPEFVERFAQDDTANGRFFRPSESGAGGHEGHSLFDLPGYIGDRLARAGIAEFSDTRLCTYADQSRFYSYRRTTHRAETDYGRLISAIAVTP